MNDDRTLSFYGIQGGSVLTFKRSMAVSACFSNRSGTFYDSVVHTSPSDLIADVKAKIAECDGLVDMCVDKLEISMRVSY